MLLIPHSLHILVDDSENNLMLKWLVDNVDSYSLYFKCISINAKPDQVLPKRFLVILFTNKMIESLENYQEWIEHAKQHELKFRCSYY